MNMCAAITVPIIKDGYRLYPGMPVSTSSSKNSTTNSSASTQRPSSSTTIYQQNHHRNNWNYHGQASISGSPPDSMASSPPNRVGVVNGNRTNNIIIGGPTGAGVHHQVVLLQPRTRTTSNQSHISARSSFEVGPTQMNSSNDSHGNHRTAMSTSQLYIQKRRELCIQQQLQKQELAKKQLLQNQSKIEEQKSIDVNKNPNSQASSSFNAASGSASAAGSGYSLEEQRKRKTSQTSGDHNNNNSDTNNNPFRKLLRRLGFGNSSNSNGITNECESGIEQGISVTESGIAVTAWH